MSATPRVDAFRANDDGSEYFDRLDDAIALAANLESELTEANRVISDGIGWVPVSEPPKDGHYITHPERPVFSWGGDRYHPVCYRIMLPPLPEPPK